jgi:hypothetical protein
MEVGVTRSESCPIGGSGIGGIQPSGYAMRYLRMLYLWERYIVSILLKLIA